MSANSLRSGLKGPTNIRFKDGHHIRYSVPDYQLGGMVMGERSIEAIGNMLVEDVTNNTKAILVFSTYKKSGIFKKTESGSRDGFEGIIYTANEKDF